MKTYEYYLITKPKWGFTHYERYGNPIHDIWLTDDEEKAIELYNKYQSTSGAPCKVMINIDDNESINDVRKSIVKRLKYSKKELLGIVLNVNTYWVD